MANLQVRLDDALRDQAQDIAASMGLDLASAVRIFIYQMVRTNGMPFTPMADPFYSPKNTKHLEKVLADLDNRRHLAKHDLIED